MQHVFLLQDIKEQQDINSSLFTSLLLSTYACIIKKQATSGKDDERLASYCERENTTEKSGGKGPGRKHCPYEYHLFVFLNKAACYSLDDLCVL